MFCNNQALHAEISCADPPVCKLQELLQKVFQIPLQQFFTCGKVECRMSRPMGRPQDGMVRVIHLPVTAASTLEDLLADFFLGKNSDARILCNELTECGPVIGLQSWKIASLPFTIIINLKRVDVSSCFTCAFYSA